MINKLQIIIILLIIPIGLVYLYSQKNNVVFQDYFSLGTPVMHIGDVPLRVEIANSNEERTTGLSYRDTFKSAEGLLFVFPKTDFHAIWMKDMSFPIDIIWISEDLKVINIEKNVTPDSYPRIFRPNAPARYTVETNVHYSDTFGLREGLEVTLPKGYLEN